MVSNQILQKTIDGLKAIVNVDLCVLDTEGNILVTTGAEMKHCVTYIDALIQGDAESQTVPGGQLFKIHDEYQVEYILCVAGEDEHASTVGKIAVFQIQSLLVAYKERFDKDNFIKNLLLDNLLLVDIYNRAKKLHIDTEVRRVIFIIEMIEEKESNTLERV